MDGNNRIKPIKMQFDIGKWTEPKVYAKLVINHGTLQLELTDHKGESNIILGISPEGELTKYILKPTFGAEKCLVYNWTIRAKIKTT